MQQAGAARRGRIAVGACLLLAGVLAVTAAVLWPQAPTGSSGPGTDQVLRARRTESSATSVPAPTTTAAAGSTGPARTAATVPVPRSDPPAALTVPGLDVDAEIAAVGARDDGAMEIPRDGATVGWYRWGPEPGATAGNAVLAGHVSTRAGGLGVLAPLAGIEVGETIDVRTVGGAELGYRVVSVETITKSVLPVAELFARDGPPRLVLITCGGPFQPELGSFRDNVVVVAEPVPGGSAGQGP